MNKMFCYAWFEKKDPSETKFGERWVTSNDPTKEIKLRIHQSLGVRKDIQRELAHIWDVSEYAKYVHRFKMHGRVDDEIRNAIPALKFSRKGRVGEVHTIPTDELIIAVNQHLAKLGQKLPPVKLSTKQGEMAERAINAFRQGKQIILADLCARLGKTIWAGVLITELNIPLTIVSSYVKTVFTSFQKDLTSFRQFQNLIHIDTQKEGYQEEIAKALRNGKQVVVYLSMCNGSKRKPRINYLHSRKELKLWIIDEADLGVHCSKQSKPLIDALKPQDKVVLMTGTNADRAVSGRKIDEVLSVTYPELLVQKGISSNA